MIEEPHADLLLENLLMRQLIDSIERINHGLYREISDSEIRRLIEEWRNGYTPVTTIKENAPRFVPSKLNPELPRRCMVPEWVAAEHTIAAAVDAVERMPGHPLLTDAVILLGQAKDKVADFVELPKT